MGKTKIYLTHQLRTFLLSFLTRPFSASRLSVRPTAKSSNLFILALLGAISVTFFQDFSFASSSPQDWGLGCFDNNCVWVKDPALTGAGGQTYTVTTMNSAGATLNTYSNVTVTNNTLTFHPVVGDAKLLNSSQGLNVAIAPTGASTEFQFSALKPILGATVTTTGGVSFLNITLNSNGTFNRAPYNLTVFDQTNTNQIAFFKGVSSSSFPINLSSNPLVTTDYQNGGIYLQLQSTALSSPFNGRVYAVNGAFGILDNFSRATQLQGNYSLVAQGLVTVSDNLGYLLKSKQVTMPYVPNPKLTQEIPFADTFSITRSLGGDTQKSVNAICNNTNYNYGSLFCGTMDSENNWPLEALDYAYMGPNQTLMFNHELITGQTSGGEPPNALVPGKLTPYLQAGYSPSDMTLVLINIPWDIARTATQSASVSPCISNYPKPGSSGQWGQCNPPADFGTYRYIIEKQLWPDLQTTCADLGISSANCNFAFEVGDEYDEIGTYNGTTQDFYSLYESAYNAIQAVQPSASIVPGDFTAGSYNCFASGTCNTTGSQPNVYDSQQFLANEIYYKRSPPYMPRSSNVYWDSPGNPFPSAMVTDAATSYAYIATGGNGVITPEIHQFGFEHMPWGQQEGNIFVSDTSSIAANWHFQSLMGLKAAINPRRVFNWGGVETFNAANAAAPYNQQYSFLNGAGYVQILFDNNQGAELFNLGAQMVSGNPKTAEIMAVAMVEGNNVEIVVSNIDLTPGDSSTQVTFQVPLSWLGNANSQTWSYLRNSESKVDNVYAQLEEDFLNNNILANDFKSFSACFATPMDLSTSICFANPMAMTTSQSTAATVIYNNWKAYQSIMQSTLFWRPITSVAANGSLNIDQNGVTHSFNQTNGNISPTTATITVTVGPSEMLVLKPTTN